MASVPCRCGHSCRYGPRAASGTSGSTLPASTTSTPSALSTTSVSRPAEVMATSPCLVSPETPIDELLPMLSGGLYHDAIVVAPDGTLLGMITQTDLLAALWRGHVAERVARAPA